MDIIIDEALKAYIDPLTPEEYAALERSILAEGCRDALVLWGQLLIDGHNRYGICRKHGLAFQTVQNSRFQSLEDVHLWMIDQHLGRRSVSDFQRGVLALRKREILQQRRSRHLQAGAAIQPAQVAATEVDSELAPWEEGDAQAPASTVLQPAVQETAPIERLNSREELARLARLSASQVQQIEKIQQQAAPELVAALKAGAISLNAAAVVATLPAEQQAAAALAGKDELKQVVKRLREAKRKPRAEPTSAEEAVPDAAAWAALQQQVQDLREENQGLRQQLARLQAELRDLQG
jgi:hypothetical protein